MPKKCSHLTFIHIIAPSGTPLNFAANANSSRVVILSWEPPQLQQQNGDITGYIVAVIPIIGGERMNYETDEHSLVVEGLLPHTTYECIVAAMTSVGTGPFSRIVTVDTHEEGKYRLHFIIMCLFWILFQLQVVFQVIPVDHLLILLIFFSRGILHHSIKHMVISRSTGSLLLNMKQMT